MGMSAYEIAWILVICSALFASCCIWMFPKVRRLLGLFVLGLFLTVVLLPYEFDQKNYAPAIIILIFKGFLERETDLSGVANFLGLSVVGYCLFGLLLFLLSSLRKGRSMTKSRSR